MRLYAIIHVGTQSMFAQLFLIYLRYARQWQVPGIGVAGEKSKNKKNVSNNVHVKWSNMVKEDVRCMYRMLYMLNVT